MTSTDDDENMKDMSEEDNNKRGNDDEVDGASIRRKIKLENEDILKKVSRTKDLVHQNGGGKPSDLYENLPEPVLQEQCNEEDSDDSTTKSKKKKKKDKKEKKKKRKKDKDRGDKDDSRKKKRELASQISLAKRIAEKEKRETRSR